MSLANWNHYLQDFIIDISFDNIPVLSFDIIPNNIIIFDIDEHITIFDFHSFIFH